MYIAIGVLLLGIILGRVLARALKVVPLGKLVFAAVLTLLFILGAQIGANARLFSQLHKLGWQALALTALALVGTILAAWLLQKLVGKPRA